MILFRAAFGLGLSLQACSSSTLKFEADGRTARMYVATATSNPPWPAPFMQASHGTVIESSVHGQVLFDIKNNGALDGVHVISRSSNVASDAADTQAHSLYASGDALHSGTVTASQIEIINSGGSFRMSASEEFPFVSGSNFGAVLESAYNGHLYLKIANNDPNDGVHVISRTDNDPTQPADQRAHSFLNGGDAWHLGTVQAAGYLNSKGRPQNHEWHYVQDNRGLQVKHNILSWDIKSNLIDLDSTNAYFEIVIQVTGTGTLTCQCKYEYIRNGSVSNPQTALNHISGNSAASSNRPYMGLDGDNPYWLMSHATSYKVWVHVKSYGWRPADWAVNYAN